MKMMGQQPPNKLHGTTGVQSAEIAAHTPGPWVVKDKNGCEFEINTDEQEPWHVALICGCCGAGDDPISRSPANARLIAAAPDMLHALEEAEWLLNEFHNWRADEDVTERVLSLIQRTIAKATGERSPVAPSPSNEEGMVQS